MEREVRVKEWRGGEGEGVEREVRVKEWRGR